MDLILLAERSFHQIEIRSEQSLFPKQCIENATTERCTDVAADALSEAAHEAFSDSAADFTAEGAGGGAADGLHDAFLIFLRFFFGSRFCEGLFFCELRLFLCFLLRELCSFRFLRCARSICSSFISQALQEFIGRVAVDGLIVFSTEL